VPEKQIPTRMSSDLIVHSPFWLTTFPHPETELEKISRRAFALRGPHRAPKLIAPSGSECERKIASRERNKRNAAMRTQRLTPLVVGAQVQVASG